MNDRLDRKYCNFHDFDRNIYAFVLTVIKIYAYLVDESDELGDGMADDELFVF